MELFWQNIVIVGMVIGALWFLLHKYVVGRKKKSACECCSAGFLAAKARKREAEISDH